MPTRSQLLRTRTAAVEALGRAFAAAEQAAHADDYDVRSILVEAFSDVETLIVEHFRITRRITHAYGGSVTAPHRSRPLPFPLRPRQS